jgi:hypothetical protein
MPFTLNACILVDNVYRVAFGNRFGRAFGDAGATGNAFFGNRHGHGLYSPKYSSIGSIL